MTRVSLRLECVGDNHIQEMRSADALFGSALGKSGMSNPWCARITGMDSRFGFRREFMDGQKDYSQANSVGSRGIYLYYTLPPGVYEVFSRETWQGARRYFIRVQYGKITEIDRRAVITHLTEEAGREHPDPFPG